MVHRRIGSRGTAERPAPGLSTIRMSRSGSWANNAPQDVSDPPRPWMSSSGGLVEPGRRCAYSRSPPTTIGPSVGTVSVVMAAAPRRGGMAVSSSKLCAWLGQSTGSAPGVPFARARDGTRLRYDVAGGDLNAPAALLVMGLALRGEAWGETRDRLASAGYRTITMDNRGAGESPVPSFKYSIARMADDAVAVMHEAFVRRTHVVGLSLGGMIAQELALLHPGRVGALVLQSTTAGRPWPRYVAPTVGLRWAAVLRALVARDAERRDRILLRVVTTG